MKKTTLLLLLFLSSQLSFGQIAQDSVPLKKEVRIALQGGYAYRLAKLAGDTPPILKDYANGLKSGYSFGLDAVYFLKPSWGLGLKYSRFGSSGSMSNMNITYDDGTGANGNISDDVAINFVGPSYVSKYSTRNPDHTFFGGLSLGYLGYSDKAVLVDQSLKITGATFGAALDLGYDYAISKYITLGAQASLTGGSLSKVTVDYGYTTETRTLEEEQRENLSRLDIGVGLRMKI